jgi:hypothetical protein
VELRHLRRSPPALAGDDLECLRIVRNPAHEQRLQDPLGRNRLRQIGQLSFFHAPARLERAWPQQVNGDGARGPQPVELCIVLGVLAEQRGQAATQRRAFRFRRH